jgi:hypothetical protein
MDNKILKRFIYLESVLEPDQNRILFETSRNLLMEVFNQIIFDKYPDIGVNDAGQTIAEWHNYEDYAIISIIPLSEDRILFEGMKKNNALLTVSTSHAELFGLSGAHAGVTEFLRQCVIEQRFTGE